MIRKSKENLEWLEFEIFAEHPELVHGVFLRGGGVSQNSFSSLNVLRDNGDDFENVGENRKRIQEALKLDYFISAHQVHQTHIQLVQEPRKEFPNSDGLMTQCKNWGLVAMHADCQAAIFYDPLHQAIATVHAGWRGQTKDIYRKTIASMQEAFGTKPEDLLVAISPSLGPDHSEFIHFRTELPEEFWSFQIKPTYFDLWTIARYQIEASGVLPHHLQIACIDTYAHPKDFYSYRREKASGRLEKITGAHATVAALLDRGSL